MEAISLFVQPHPVLKKAVDGIIRSGRIPYDTLKYDSGQYLFREGEATSKTYLLNRGLVRLFSNNQDGNSKTVFFYKAGSLIGFQKLQRVKERWPSILNAKATTKCEAYVLAADDFIAALKEDGEACFALSQYLFEQLALQTRESVNASIYSVLQRFAALLLMLSKEFGAMQAPAIIPFTNDELAEMLGVHVNSITNSINALRKSECVEKRRSTLIVIDFEKLHSVAENLVSKG